MGERGPGAKPFDIRVLEGTAGQVVAIPTTNEPASMPDDLLDEAKRIWVRVQASFSPGYFKAVDEEHLAGYCRATVLWRTATAEIEQALARNEEPAAWWGRIKAQAHTERVQLGDRLGIGPAKRAQSVAATAQAKKDFFRPK